MMLAQSHFFRFPLNCNKLHGPPEESLSDPWSLVRGKRFFDTCHLAPSWRSCVLRSFVVLLLGASDNYLQRCQRIPYFLGFGGCHTLAIARPMFMNQKIAISEVSR